MQFNLTAMEVNELSRFRFTNQITGGRRNIAVIELLDQVSLHNHLNNIGKQIGSPTQRVTASLLTKRMAFYAVIHLYTMSVLNKRLNVDIKEMKLVEKEDDSLWLPDFYLGNFVITELYDNRNQWRATIVENLFAHFFHPLIEALREATRFSKMVMWENIAIYVFWLYESLLKEEKDKEIIQRIEDDFCFIMQKAEGALFGPYIQNPLARFDREKTYREEINEWIRVRKTCCLSNLLEAKDGKRCSTCPNGCNMSPFKRDKGSGPSSQQRNRG
ncbi:MAG: IucA/IucC family C-terminal-domain containing protein [Heyndrickxia sp.]